MNNKFKSLALATLMILGMKSVSKLPIASAEGLNRQMIVTTQNNLQREYSPEVIKLYNAYLQGIELQNQMHPESPQSLIYGIEVADQAYNMWNMRFPFEDGLSQAQLDDRIIDVNCFSMDTIFNAVLFNIVDGYPSTKVDDPYDRQYLLNAEQLAKEMWANPRNIDLWIECIKSIKDMDRNSNSPNLEYLKSNILLGAKGFIDVRYVYEQPNSNRIFPVLAYGKIETNKEGLTEEVLFHSNDSSGSTFSQISEYGNYWSYDSKGEKVFTEFTQQELLNIGAIRYGLYQEFEEAHLSSVDALGTIIRANAKTLSK